MATKTDPFKLDYLVLSAAEREAVVRENLAQREAEHFRLYTAFGQDPSQSPRLEAVTEEVKRLQAELKAVEA